VGRRAPARRLGTCRTNGRELRAGVVAADRRRPHARGAGSDHDVDAPVRRAEPEIVRPDGRKPADRRRQASRLRLTRSVHREFGATSRRAYRCPENNRLRVGRSRLTRLSLLGSRGVPAGEERPCVPEFRRDLRRHDALPSRWLLSYVFPTSPAAFRFPHTQCGVNVFWTVAERRNANRNSQRLTLHCRQLGRRDMPSEFADKIDIALFRSTLTSRVALAPFYDDFPMTIPLKEIFRSKYDFAYRLILSSLGRCKEAVTDRSKGFCFGWRNEEVVLWIGGAERAHRTTFPEASDDDRERDDEFSALSVWDRPTCHRSAFAGI